MRYVPTDEFAPVLRRVIASEDPEKYAVVAERAGVSLETLEQILRERRKGCDFNIADRLLCALGGQHLWWSELAHIYYAIDLDFHERPHEVREHVCRKGHKTTAKVAGNGYTYCSVCDRENNLRYKARRRAKELAGREEARAA